MKSKLLPKSIQELIDILDSIQIKASCIEDITNNESILHFSQDIQNSIDDIKKYYILN